MSENKQIVSIINIHNTTIEDIANTVISMKGLEKIPLNEAIDAVRCLYPYNM